MLAGGVAYLQLPVSALPEVDYPIIQAGNGSQQRCFPGAAPADQGNELASGDVERYVVENDAAGVGARQFAQVDAHDPRALR